MAAYVVVTVDDVTDPDKIAKYRELSGPALAKAGGRYIARGGEMASLEGGWEPGRLVIVEFPTLEAAKAWYNSPEYQAAHHVREGAANFKMVAVEGL